MINIIAYQIMCTALISFVKNHMHNKKWKECPNFAKK